MGGNESGPKAPGMALGGQVSAKALEAGLRNRFQRLPPDSAPLHSPEKSELKPPKKTPLPHGLTGLSAIEVTAKNDGLQRAAAKTGWHAAAMKSALDKIPRPPCKRPVKPGCDRHSCPEARQRTQSARQTRPECVCFRSLFRSKSKAQKTPLSHGLTGLAAIKSGAKFAMFPEHEQRQNSTPQRKQGPVSMRKQEPTDKLPNADWLEAGFGPGLDRVWTGFGPGLGRVWAGSRAACLAAAFHS